MNTRRLHEQILGPSAPWGVERDDKLELNTKAQEVIVRISCSVDALVCPDCGAACPGYDWKKRR